MDAGSPEHPNEATQFAVLLFTDICDSTGLKATHGAIAYKTAAELHNALFERLAAEEKLSLIKNTGDGYFARTSSVAAAARFALRFQHGMRTMAWPAFALTTRVGIHAGEVADITTLGQADVLAPAADLVARVMSLAMGGQILLTRWPFDEARHFVREHPRVPDAAEPPRLAWLAHGPYLFKGCEDPVEVFEVGAEGLAPLAAPPDGEKARRAIRPGEEQTLGWRPAAGLQVPGRAGWTLSRKLGEGGFGEVWLAEQAKLRQRRVFKFCFDDERLRSFKRELTFFRLIRDALGERNDIARLYDVKLDAPPFFLESEFAEDGNLLEWSEKQGGIATVPLARRLEIATRVADAVSAAHSVGILHKDLKPQNVLMQSGRRGEVSPQLTDFGIGALADHATLSAHAITAAGFTVNTLLSGTSGMTRLYAPPEQMTGKAYTVQGDVYALGVMLYQLVVGDFGRALAPGWEREVKDELLREDIAECVDGDPAHRLSSAAVLAERLRSLDERRAERTRDREQARLAEELAAVKARAAAERERWKRARRIAVIVGVLAMAAIGAGIFAVGQAHTARMAEAKAYTAEQLAQSRLGHAEKARDAAEQLVSKAIFGLREKLAPLGKISVLEELASAAEEYYAKLPPELVSDATRRHEVWMALNRALIAHAVADDVTAEAAALKAVSLSRELSLKDPADETLLEDRFFALLGMAGLRFQQERNEEAVDIAAQLRALGDEWLAAKPNAAGALRAKLAGLCISILVERRSETGFARLLPMVMQAQAISDQLKALDGESLETRMMDAASKLGKALVMSKVGKPENAVKLFQEADAAFRAAVATEGGNFFVYDAAVSARRWSVEHLRQLAEQRSDVALAQEAYRQNKELLADQTALAEAEPQRLERWRVLAWLYYDHAIFLKQFADATAVEECLVKGIAIADRAASPKFQRDSVRRARAWLRATLAEELLASRREGWETRAFPLLQEAADSLVPPGEIRADDGATRNPWKILVAWVNAARAVGENAEQRGEMIKQFRAIVAFCQRWIEAVPENANVVRDMLGNMDVILAILQQHGRAEIAEFKEVEARWRAEFAARTARQADGGGAHEVSPAREK